LGLEDKPCRLSRLLGHPTPATLGDVRRNTLRAPAYWSIDLALSRFAWVGARLKTELRVEAFNLLNTSNWGAPTSGIPARTDASLGSTFGRITSTAGTLRVMQLGLRVSFD
jgi:hypothetical protein